MLRGWRHKQATGDTSYVYTPPTYDPDEPVGQSALGPSLGHPLGLTDDDIEWARELGASTDEEILDLIRKHKESLA